VGLVAQGRCPRRMDVRVATVIETERVLCGRAEESGNLENNGPWWIPKKFSTAPRDAAISGRFPARWKALALRLGRKGDWAFSGPVSISPQATRITSGLSPLHPGNERTPGKSAFEALLPGELLVYGCGWEWRKEAGFVTSVCPYLSAQTTVDVLNVLRVEVWLGRAKRV
jgi:hypothetical protein